MKAMLSDQIMSVEWKWGGDSSIVLAGTGVNALRRLQFQNKKFEGKYFCRFIYFFKDRFKRPSYVADILYTFRLFSSESRS